MIQRHNPPPEPCYTVSGLTRELKGLLESRYPVLRIRGEISNLRRQASGHIYFSLKDAGASISCVCFRNDAARLRIRIRDGLQVVGTGRIGLYEPRGTYQVIFRTLEEDGIGRLQQAFQDLKEKLQAEGLFDKSRKQPIPKLPGCIGFVTSPTGAALRDFISILRRRQWRGRLVVIPVRVQGEGAAAEIAAGIAAANTDHLCDLLVIGRGGGSLEDLWPFNEEIVSRAVADSRIPVISAVGHETDFALSDFAADLRAETPSAAAEWITSAWQALLEQCLSLESRLRESTGRQLERHRHRLALATANLRHQHPRNRLEQAAMRLDEIQNRLDQALAMTLRESAHRLRHARSRFQSLRPEQQLQYARDRLRQLRLRLINNSHQATLKRGYALIRQPEDQAVLSDAAQISPGMTFEVEMRDARFSAQRQNRKPASTDGA